MVSVFLAGGMSLALLSCGRGAEERAAAVKQAEPLPPQAREMIRMVMTNQVNPTYMSMWTLVNRGDIEHVPPVAKQLRDAAERARTTAPGIPGDMLELYRRMGAISDSVAIAGAAGNFPETIRLTKSLKQSACDACHAKYQR
jgi:hypothetical protein